jgi:3-deoxy-manno-octulosonate cytidylyltransferase (CMP-KDO synthetase)
MRVLGVIPARMGSSRFPGKPLARIGGAPMIEHVYRGTAGSRLLDDVVVATCDREIAAACTGFGARAVLTSSTHDRASDRVAEVSAGDDAGIVVMVQGDEPMVTPAMVDATIGALSADPEAACVNLCAPILDEREARDPNTIKVVTSRDGRALYFSRAMIPAVFVPQALHKQVCVIAFRRDALLQFSSLPRGPLEGLESIDMLRFLENGIPVRMQPTDVVTHAVDTVADLERVSGLMGFS